MTMPTADFWFFLVVLFILTLTFCIWMGIRSSNFEETEEFYITIKPVGKNHIVGYQVWIVRKDFELPENKQLVEYLSKLGQFKDKHTAKQVAIYQAQERNLEFKP